MTWPRRDRGIFFSLSPSFAQLFSAICPPICLPPLPPSRCCGMPKRYPRRSGRGIFYFFERGAIWPSPPFCIPQRDFPARRGHAQILAGWGLVPLLFPPSAHPPAPSRCCGVPKRCPRRSGRGIFYFFKRGSGHRPPFASPRGTFLPGGAMRKFWRGGTFFHLSSLGMRKARKQMLPGF